MKTLAIYTKPSLAVIKRFFVTINLKLKSAVAE